MLGNNEKPRKSCKVAPSILAQVIKDARIELNMTQKSFAEMTGVGLKAIRTLEQGGHSVGLDKVIQVMAFLGFELVPMPRKDAEKSFKRSTT